MGQRLRLFETDPGFAWILTILGTISFIMLIVLLVSSTMYNPPDDPATLKYFSKDFLVKAAQYNRLNMVLSVSAKALMWLFMAIALWIGWKYFSGPEGHVHIYIAAGYIALFYIILNLIILPLSYYSGYIVEHKFGLSNQTVGMWFIDFAKSRGIEMTISVAAFTGIYWLMSFIPKYWWLIAASIIALFILIGTYLYPLLIDPLFYRFSNLEDQVLREEILEVTGKAGIEVQDILVADASRKTTKANAYFTGFGNTKRIVLYDNLLNNFSREEALNVVAHEAAHWKYSHIAKSIAISIAASFLGLYILNIILIRTGLRGDLRSIFVIILLISLVSFISVPVQNVLSRYFEIQADELSLELTGEYDTQIKLMTGLAEANLSNVDPHPIIRAMLYSHPPIMERIESAESQRRTD